MTDIDSVKGAANYCGRRPRRSAVRLRSGRRCLSRSVPPSVARRRLRLSECLHPGKHVLDESQQLDFIREVTDTTSLPIGVPGAASR